MASWFGFRALLAVSAILAVLLASLAIVQYRWSARVTGADVQREKEHLDSAASLFASEFNNSARQAVAFLQNDAWNALQSGTRLTGVPKLIAELYYLETPPQGTQKVRRLLADSIFRESVRPDWMVIAQCGSVFLEQPMALVVPVYDITSSKIDREPLGSQVLQTFRVRPEHCFVARLDRDFLRYTYIPQLIGRSFGATAAGEYEFAVVSNDQPGDTIYGTPVRADLKKRFFSVMPTAPRSKPSPEGSGARNTLFIQHFDTVSKGTAGSADLFGAGIWELQTAHKGAPLAATFERARIRNLLFSLAVELLLAAAIVLLLLGVRRMQRLAEQKMQFIAGVSHELRTPVSTISMLARNQADGLIAGPEKVRQYGELIHQQSRRLNEMVEQTLQHAGIHSSLRRLAKNEIDVSRLIQEAVEVRREELTGREFEIEMALSPDLPRVIGDAQLLRTAFDNLLTNAEKYAGGGRWIRVSAAFSARDKEVQISIEDRGDGVELGEQREIFEPFSRGRAAIEAQIPGSGLGLTLVRDAAEAHRGSVTLVSEPGRGSTFTLHLPV